MNMKSEGQTTGHRIKIWINGLLEVKISGHLVHQNPQDLELYTEDSQGPIQFHESDNNVVRLPVEPLRCKSMTDSIPILKVQWDAQQHCSFVK